MDACRKKCANTEGCAVFGANTETLICNLKGDNHQGEKSFKGMTSGRMSCYKGHYCWKKGFSLPGGEIKSIPFTTIEACKEECAKTEGCVAFNTVAGIDNRCYLKNKDHGAESKASKSISVRMSCYKDHYCLKKGIRFKSGGDISKKTPFTTIEACKDECAKTKGCAAFITTAGTDNMCRLKNKHYGKDGKEQADGIKITAFMSCYAGNNCKQIFYIFKCPYFHFCLSFLLNVSLPQNETLLIKISTHQKKNRWTQKPASLNVKHKPKKLTSIDIKLFLKPTQTVVLIVL